MALEYRKDQNHDHDQRAAAIKKFVQTEKPTSGHFDGKKPKGWTEDLISDLPEIVGAVERLRKGTNQVAAVDITLGQYVAERYGIATDEIGSSDNLFRYMGLNKANITLADLHRTSRQNFTTMPELNKNFEWLIGEVITEALRAGLLTRGVYRRLISSQETVPYDSIKTPIIKKPNGKWRTHREGETIRMGTIEFDEIAMEAKDIAQGFRITDKVARNVRINLLQEFLMGAVGQILDDQLTYEAVQRLLNGNFIGVDGAPIVGVASVGNLDYDNDWLEMVIGAAELGYRFDMVLGCRKMIKKAMALPEFKGGDFATRLADVVSDVPLPNQYRFVPTGAMPQPSITGGQLLFLDPRRAMKMYTTKPLSIESDRIIRELTTETVISMTYLFQKQYWDASMVLDTSTAITSDPFPTDIDAETYQAEGFGS